MYRNAVEFDAGKCLEINEEEKVTAISGNPTIWGKLLKELDNDRWGGDRQSSRGGLRKGGIDRVRGHRFLQSLPGEPQETHFRGLCGRSP
jgi:acyl-CoA synthetase (AMP-forming)/AMP-acid ligase II